MLLSGLRRLAILPVLPILTVASAIAAHAGTALAALSCAFLQLLRARFGGSTFRRKLLGTSCSDLRDDLFDFRIGLGRVCERRQREKQAGGED